METPVESVLPDPDLRDGGIELRLLGPPAILRDGSAVALPASRKVRALLGYLAMAPAPAGRSALCELLWDVPNDPRGELRWYLSKLRGLLDEPGRRRVVSAGDTVALDLAGCDIDAAAVEAAAQAGLDRLDAGGLRALLRRFGGDFLDGLAVDRSPAFSSWLAARRRRFRSIRIAAVERLAALMPAASDETLALLEAWLELAPVDVRAHRGLLAALAERGQTGACEEHLKAAARLFAAEDVDFEPVRAAWRTLRGRPAAPVATSGAAAVPAAAPPVVPDAAGRRASIAVMPLQHAAGPSAPGGGLADALTHDVITRLARLRSLFVIARGSVYALAAQGIGPDEAARRLDVDYLACGHVREHKGQVVVSVELVEARSARIVWAESFDAPADGALLVLDAIGDRIVATIAGEVEAAERNRALLKPPDSLNAWEAYHRGLWHMYRFTREENAEARRFFEMAVRQDPTFARAHAGLSFTHWQSAFQQWEDRDRQSALAYEAAGHGLLADDHDPAAHWAMGRALWLRGGLGESLSELQRAVELSPNFALGHYALSFVQSQSGDATAAIGASDHSRRLSPFDPLLFGMLGTRAMALVRLGRFAEAADWAVKAAARPNAHATILAIAAHCLALAGRAEEGRGFAATIRRTLPAYGVDDFLRTFRFPPDAEALFRQAARQIGLG